ncbi:arylamine N-acetyltransferase [Pseudonocardiaceae bacterium YIM PH 21723]|nr:arylamine N-acetyltransferase [Pseudonocardiaceae bacterium YIM PH 21723]
MGCMETGDHLDLPAYLRRVGLDRAPSVDLDGLRTLHAAQLSSVAFENIDPLVGRIPDIMLPDLQRKLVGKGRGGRCFENNSLLRAALESVGFTVKPLIGRVRYDTDVIPARTHALTLVTLDGRQWLTDVGFGIDALAAPIELADGAESEHNGWHHQLRREHWLGSPHWTLHLLRGQEDTLLYSFLDEETPFIDYQLGYHYTTTSGRSRFGKHLYFAADHGGKRSLLVRNRFSHVTGEGPGEERQLAAAELTAGFLREEFQLTVTEEDLAVLRAHPDMAASAE